MPADIRWLLYFDPGLRFFLLSNIELCSCLPLQVYLLVLSSSAYGPPWKVSNLIISKDDTSFDNHKTCFTYDFEIPKIGNTK